MDFQKTPFPGTIFGGRFPINVSRPLMWAFEWHDTEALSLSAGRSAVLRWL